MTAPAYEVARVDELESFPVDEEGLTWRPIRRRFDVRAFGVNAYTAERAGQRVVEEHTERTNGHEEIYVVLHGRATFALDGEEVDVPAGAFVHLPDPGTRRGAVAVEDGTTVLALGAKPGVPFEPSAWEETFAAYGYRRLGDLERGREVMRAHAERNPDAWQGQYHLACFAALDGEREAALEHLLRAVEMDPEAARWAAEDEDFDSIRDDPRFPSPPADATGNG
jgi:quercetin dioxygenase-like cupin family protein